MIKAILYGSMIFLGALALAHGTFFAPTIPQILAGVFLGGFTLIAGTVFLKDWFDKTIRKDGPYWALEVMDDLGVWGLVSWGDIHAKAQVHCNMLIHHRSSLDVHFKLEDLIRHINTLQERKVFDYIYHARHMRMRNTVTDEVIPIEALGLSDNSTPTDGWHKVSWAPRVP